MTKSKRKAAHEAAVKASQDPTWGYVKPGMDGGWVGEVSWRGDRAPIGWYETQADATAALMAAIGEANARTT